MRTPEQENKLWFRILDRLGSYELERKLQRRPLVRQYNSHWPLDAKTNPNSLESMYEAGITVEDVRMSHQEHLILKQSTNDWLDTLTDKQAFVVNKSNEGYKPAEIAAELGDDESGKVRYHKWAAKKKAKEEFDRD